MLSFLRLEHKQKDSSNPFRVPVFFFLTHLELKRQKRSYSHVVPLKTISDSRPKWEKSIPVFPDQAQNSYAMWRRIPITLFKGVPPEAETHTAQ